MRKLLVTVVAAASVGVPAAAALAATRTVKVGDNYFLRRGKPPTISVPTGTTVRFRWVGEAPHNVRAYRGPRRFKSKVKASGTFSRTLSRAGTYRLLCDVHPKAMRMTIRVG